MVKKSILINIINEELKGSDKFLVDILVKRDDKIFVFIDSDTNLTIQDCIDLTKTIEGKLDRDKEDFELMVSSPGLEYPLALKQGLSFGVRGRLNVWVNPISVNICLTSLAFKLLDLCVSRYNLLIVLIQHQGCMVLFFTMP